MSNSQTTKRPLEPGDLVIMNDFDRPCDDLIAEVDVVEAYTTLDGTPLGAIRGHYVRDGSPVRGPAVWATLVEDFGRTVRIEPGNPRRIYTVPSGEDSSATYLDGLPRLWQEES